MSENKSQVVVKKVRPGVETAQSCASAAWQLVAASGFSFFFFFFFTKQQIQMDIYIYIY